MTAQTQWQPNLQESLLQALAQQVFGATANDWSAGGNTKGKGKGKPTYTDNNPRLALSSEKPKGYQGKNFDPNYNSRLTMSSGHTKGKSGGKGNGKSETPTPQQQNSPHHYSTRTPNGPAWFCSMCEVDHNDHTRTTCRNKTCQYPRRELWAPSEWEQKEQEWQRLRKMRSSILPQRAFELATTYGVHIEEDCEDADANHSIPSNHLSAPRSRLTCSSETAQASATTDVGADLFEDQEMMGAPPTAETSPVSKEAEAAQKEAAKQEDEINQEIVLLESMVA